MIKTTDTLKNFKNSLHGFIHFSSTWKKEPIYCLVLDQAKNHLPVVL